MNQNIKFDIVSILKRIIPKLDDMIDFETNRKRISRMTFFNRQECNDCKFPISRDTYYSYKSKINNRPSSKQLNTMDLRCFFDICSYTGIPADYYLGFIDTARNEQSAEQVRKDFGLSDKAMERLKEAHNKRAMYNGEITSEFLNLVLENDVFWDTLDERLPLYITSQSITHDEADIDRARYEIMKLIEALVVDISTQLLSNKLRYYISDDDFMTNAIIENGQAE